nr:uncharacterized protein LOC109167327 [Ipomoea batatas]
MRPEEEFALNWLGIPKIPMADLQDLLDEVLATKLSKKEAENGKGKAVSEDELATDLEKWKGNFKELQSVLQNL